MDAKWWALAVAVCSLIVAGFSLTLSIRTYNRAGPRIGVSVAKQRLFGGMSFPNYEDVLAVTVSNSGLATAQVAHLYIDVRNSRTGLVPVAPAGPALPYPINGHHEETWVPTLRVIARDARKAATGNSVEIRAAVRLGSGEIVKSTWIDVTDDVPVDG